MQGGFLLDIVIGQGPPILQLLSSKDQSLLIRRDAFFVLDLLLDVVDSIRAFDFQSYRLAGQRLDKDLHLKREGRVTKMTNKRKQKKTKRKKKKLQQVPGS